MVFREHKNNCIMTFLSLNREQDLKMQCAFFFSLNDNEFVIGVVKGYFCPPE